MATLKDIASMAGVSTATVSQVINDRGQYRIGKSTKEKVRRVMKDLNFRPNEQARSLRLHKTKTLGVVIPDLLNPFFSQLVTAIENQAFASGYQLYVTCSQDNEERETNLIRGLISRSIDGLIISSVTPQGADIPVGNPVVYIDRELRGHNIHCVTTDHFKGAYDLTKSLLDKGHTRIHYVGGLPQLSSSRERFKGYCEALREYNVKYDPRYVFEGKYDAVTGYSAITKWFDEPPTAIFAGSYAILEGVMQACQALQLTDKVQAFASFDDHPMLDLLPVNIIRARQPIALLAESTMKIMLRAIEKKIKTSETSVIPPHMVGGIQPYQSSGE